MMVEEHFICQNAPTLLKFKLQINLCVVVNSNQTDFHQWKESQFLNLNFAQVQCVIAP